MNWGTAIIALALLMTLVWVNGCTSTFLGRQQVSDFTTTNDKQAQPDQNMSGAPMASFNVQPLNGITPLKVNLDASGSSQGNASIISYEWIFGDGMSGTGINGSHTYTSAGNFTIRLTIKDNAGRTDSTYRQIIVESRRAGENNTKLPPEAQFTVTPSSGTAPLTVKLDASGSLDPDGTITAYSWDFGDGMSGTGPGGYHTFTSAGTYLVRLRVQDNSGLSGSATRQITVTYGTTTVPTTTITTTPPSHNQPPVADISAYPLSGTAPFEVKFNTKGSEDPDGTIVSYAWDFGDGQSGSGAAVSHTYGKAGTYTATLMVTDNRGATGQATTQVVVIGGVVTEKYLVKTTT
jgi:PKD repeat protein